MSDAAADATATASISEALKPTEVEANRETQLEELDAVAEIVDARAFHFVEPTVGRAG
jgi:hypothetical protein